MDPITYISHTRCRCLNLLDVSFRSELPDKAILFLDGKDARVFRRLLSELGSEDQVQNAMILCGLLAEIREGKELPSKMGVKEIESIFPEYVGVSFEEFTEILDNL